MAQAREDAARDQAGLRPAFEARLAAAEDARATLQARAERAEAELQRALADQTRRPRRPPRHNPQARHDAAGALRKLSDGQLPVQFVCRNAPMAAMESSCVVIV